MSISSISPAVANTTSGSTTSPVDQRSGQLENLLHQRLRDSGRRELAEVTGHCNARRCRLTGQVSTFFLKQSAQEIARHIDGIERIKNEIRVMDNHPPGNTRGTP